MAVEAGSFCGTIGCVAFILGGHLGGAIFAVQEICHVAAVQGLDPRQPQRVARPPRVYILGSASTITGSSIRPPTHRLPTGFYCYRLWLL